jgi:hypothetical protein
VRVVKGAALQPLAAIVLPEDFRLGFGPLEQAVQFP